MRAVPMMWVLPVTGPDKDAGRTCYVCQLGSSPVIAAFIKPDSPERTKYIEHVQKLVEAKPVFKAFIVILSRPEENLIRELRDIAEEKNITVPITVLDPELGLPDTVPIDDRKDINLLLYRGRIFESVIEYNPGEDTLQKVFSGTEEAQVINLSELERAEGAAFAAMGAVDGEPPPLESTFTFRILNDAAENVINRDN